MAGKTKRRRRQRGRQGRQERRSGEGDPGRRHRLQGCRHPAQVHFRARQDPCPPHHRSLSPGAEAHRPRCQERARDGSPALRRLRPLGGGRMSKLILTHEVTGLGAPGDIIDVKNGYARNYLIPTGVAVAWTPRRRKAGRPDQGGACRTRARHARGGPDLKATPEGIRSPEGQGRRQGRLFGSVKTSDIADAAAAAGLGNLDKRKIESPHPIKLTGRTRPPSACATTSSPPSASRWSQPSRHARYHAGSGAPEGSAARSVCEPDIASSNDGAVASQPSTGTLNMFLHTARNRKALVRPNQ